MKDKIKDIASSWLFNFVNVIFLLLKWSFFIGMPVWFIVNLINGYYIVAICIALTYVSYFTEGKWDWIP